MVLQAKRFATVFARSRVDFCRKAWQRPNLEAAEINEAIVSHARLGKTVVRLKGGDTGVFARTAEELERMVDEKIPFEVVPGITAALASAAYTGIR